MIEVTPIDFLGQGALLEPVDRKVHDAAVEFCKKNLADEVNFTKLAKVWVGIKDGEIQGICGYVLRPDIPLFRSLDYEVTAVMRKRMNDFFCDNGWRGNQVFIYIGNEAPEARCPDWRQSLKDCEAKSARRLLIEVK